MKKTWKPTPKYTPPTAQKIREAAEAEKYANHWRSQGEYNWAARWDAYAKNCLDSRYGQVERPVNKGEEQMRRK